MCGIVGLHLRNPDLYSQLGELLGGMLQEMQDRGADSAGVAVYGNPAWVHPGTTAVSVLELDSDHHHFAERVGELTGQPTRASYVGDVVLLTSAATADVLVEAVRAITPQAVVAGYGPDLAVLKGVGAPRELAASWGLPAVQGWQGVGHTRMATESAVTPAGCHPYAVGEGQCLVHNGSFSNHATIRRQLRASGVRFDSENDTEVAARFVANQLDQGFDIEIALKQVCANFDGFYTLLVSNHDSFAIVRDAIACKPAVIAETADLVAVASEYRAFVSLPGIEGARIWEPQPEVVYAWTR